MTKLGNIPSESYSFELEDIHKTMLTSLLHICLEPDTQSLGMTLKVLWLSQITPILPYMRAYGQYYL